MAESSEAHKLFLRHAGRFSPSCSHQIFSIEEWEALCQFGHWFKALVEGKLLAYTDAQRRFIQVANGELAPETLHENVWFKYLKRKEIEEKYSGMHNIPRVGDDTFHNRESIKAMKRMQRNFGKT